MIECDFLVLCDKTRIYGDHGKYMDISGEGQDTVISPVYPYGPFTLNLAARLRYAWTDVLGGKVIHIDLLDADGRHAHPRAPGEWIIRIEQKTPLLNEEYGNSPVSLGLHAVILPAPGLYTITLRLLDLVLARRPFTAVVGTP